MLNFYAAKVGCKIFGYEATVTMIRLFFAA
jgi:hypothetical protein